ncbi:MAG: bifunctional hydroxymethylpyrimidine kinase/phosphomethylpyrimidine kinase [Cohaesibacteraceae bacterium]
MTDAIPNILSIAGSDPSGGAGIQADLKAISAQRAYGMAALTALTAQNTQGVSGVHLVPPDFVANQIHDVFADINVHAVKIGMIASGDIARAVAYALKDHADVPVVLDPVMVAKGGARLLDEDAVGALRSALLPHATIITPNLPEAAALLDVSVAANRQDMEEQAVALLDHGPGAALVKGGHLTGEDCSDLLATRDGVTWFEGERIATPNTHGTGCTLSSALAAQIGHGRPLTEAVAAAKAYVATAIAQSNLLSVGHGHGHTHHFHNLWSAQP